MSSPNINNLMLVGGMMAYISIVLLGVDTGIASDEVFIGMCKVDIQRAIHLFHFNTFISILTD